MTREKLYIVLRKRLRDPPTQIIKGNERVDYVKDLGGDLRMPSHIQCHVDLTCTGLLDQQRFTGSKIPR